MKINARFGKSDMTGAATLTAEDIVDTMMLLVALRNGQDDVVMTDDNGVQRTVPVNGVDDIDHLGNRRVRWLKTSSVPASSALSAPCVNASARPRATTSRRRT